ncbi:reverse transcriptase domain-containing protein [Tanacetum coccineum]
MPRKKFHELAQHLQEVMEESLPKMVDTRVKELTKTQVPIYVAQGLIMERQQSQADVAKMIADAIQQECENLRAEISSQINNAISNHIPSQIRTTLMMMLIRREKRQKTIKHGTYMFGESSSGQVNESELGPSTSGNQEQLDDFDFWMDSYATDDDELSTEKVSQELVEEISQTVDEAKLRKVVNEMLRQRCTSGDEHQYHIDQMQNFLKNDIVWESRKEILFSPHPQNPTPVVQSCQRYPKAPALSLVNQDLLYLKKRNLGPEKIVMSLHKFPAVIFPDDDIEERTFRWVDKCVKKFNPYARYSIVQIIKTYWELGHEHKFMTEIIARRANVSIVSITKSDYKNLNKIDIEDLYLLIVNGKVGDYAETGLLWSLSIFIRSTMIWERVHDFQLGVESYQQKVNLTAPTITFPGIEKYKMFSIVSEPVYGIKYKNSKKEKRVMRNQEVHKFCDATLKRALEGLKNYNNNVKHGYVTPSLNKEDDEYLQLFEEEIEERLHWMSSRAGDVESGDVIELTLWDELQKPIIIAVSSCKVIEYANTLQLTVTSATFYYLNPEIPELGHLLAESVDPEKEKNRNRYPISTLLQENPDTYKVSILAKDKGFGQEMHQSEEPKAFYGVTSPKDYDVTYSNEEMSHHTLYGVKCLQDYTATFKYTRDDVSDSALWRNICDRVTP